MPLAPCRERLGSSHSCHDPDPVMHIPDVLALRA